AEAGEARAAAVGYPERGDRRLDARGSDVDDAAEVARDYGVERRSYELDRRQHVRVQGLEPRVAIPFAKVASGRPARIVDEDVGCRAGSERRAPAFLGGDVARHGGDFHAARTADLGRGGFERFAPAGGDHEPHAFARERERAGAPEPFRCRADERGLAADAEIHGQLLFTETSSTPKITSSPPSAC